MSLPVTRTAASSAAKPQSSAGPTLRVMAGEDTGPSVPTRGGVPALIATSRVMQEIVRELQRYAPTRATVLLSGESGTGKEVCAQMLHAWSRRAERPFVPVNCAALPDQLAESALFGHVEGAFTGADRARAGSFQSAQQGTLFLDEISEMQLGLQAKLLRVLEAGELQRLGSDERQFVDVRVLAATNRDLQTEVARRRFRGDLFYRINVLHVHLPPLRERPEDIPPLVEYFVRQYAQDGNGEVEGIAAEAMEMLVKYVWPGNVRELRNVIQRACIVCQTSSIQAADLPRLGETHENRATDDFRDWSLEELERRAIIHALRKYRGNKTAAARHLGVTSRTLHNKLRRDERIRKAS